MIWLGIGLVAVGVLGIGVMMIFIAKATQPLPTLPATNDPQWWLERARETFALARGTPEPYRQAELFRRAEEYERRALELQDGPPDSG